LAISVRYTRALLIGKDACSHFVTFGPYIAEVKLKEAISRTTVSQNTMMREERGGNNFCIEDFWLRRKYIDGLLATGYIPHAREIRRTPAFDDIANVT